MAIETTPPRSVCIIGAGLGGLACAVQCRRMGLDVVVLERAAVIANEVGAGIQIPPNASKALGHLGLLPEAKKRGLVIDKYFVRGYKDGKILHIVRRGPSDIATYGSPWIVIHRQDYHAMLMEEAERLGAAIKLNGCVLGIDAAASTVTLEDGTQIKSDVVVGADGLWSMARETLLGRASPPIETGDLAYRATFTREQLESIKAPGMEELISNNTQHLWMGPGKHAVFYPLRGGKEFNLVLLRPNNLPRETKRAEGDIGEMRESFRGWDPLLTRFISCITSVLKWKLFHHEELSTWTKDHVALLGDACHPTLPYQAQGAAMAVEDGVVLGILLGRLKVALETKTEPLMDLDPISEVLQLYESLRKTPTTLNVNGAIQNRHVYHMPDGREQVQRDKFYTESMNKEVVDAPQYSMIDSKYQRELLGHDRVAEAEKEFQKWWAVFGNRCTALRV